MGYNFFQFIVATCNAMIIIYCMFFVGHTNNKINKGVVGTGWNFAGSYIFNYGQQLCCAIISIVSYFIYAYLLFGLVSLVIYITNICWVEC